MEDSNNNLANILESQKCEILFNWNAYLKKLDFLNEKGISSDFLIDHFGKRILDYFINVLRNKNEPGTCPVAIVLIHFFKSKKLYLDEVYMICSGKRNAVTSQLINSDISIDDYNRLISLYDQNFSGVIREYINTNFMFQNTKSVIYNRNVGTEGNDLSQNEIIQSYFAINEGKEHITFIPEDADDMLEYIADISTDVSSLIEEKSFDTITAISNIFTKIASILLRYSPYLDELANSMNELSQALTSYSNTFIEVLQSNEDLMLSLFYSVQNDLDSYVQRFSVENIVMKNSHHIHKPTTLSIRQIITLFNDDTVEEGEIEFF